MQIYRRRFLSFLLGLSLAATALIAQAAKPVHVSMNTSEGEILLELYPDKAPKTVANFLKYVKNGHYSNTIFHRVINGFMIQGGGFDQDMNEKPAPYHVENEAKNGLKNETYTLAMARRPDPHSAGAQFFINVNNNTFLDYPGQDGWGYCVFGKVIKGMDVVDKIKAVPTTVVNGMPDVPVKQVVIKSAVLQFR
jgi:peptidyl-prolyl cis-trans isomerase A (cyclophilin A)/peptidyl-prolyl cis-trans isomerase B (cyclophilin B)